MAATKTIRIFFIARAADECVIIEEKICEPWGKREIFEFVRNTVSMLTDEIGRFRCGFWYTRLSASFNRLVGKFALESTKVFSSV